jgi:arylsulfatase A-like enzyme
VTGEVDKPARTIYIPHPSGAIVLRDGWKLISRNTVKKGAGSVELFNVTDDPLEKRNLAQAEPQRVEELQALLEALRAGDLREMPKDAGDGVVDETER